VAFSICRQVHLLFSKQQSPMHYFHPADREGWALVTYKRKTYRCHVFRGIFLSGLDMVGLNCRIPTPPPSFFAFELKHRSLFLSLRIPDLGQFLEK